MADHTSAPLSETSSRAALAFPLLTPAQIARVASQGMKRVVKAGEVLIEPGQPNVSFFVVTAGEIETVRPSSLAERMIATLGPGKFTGEAYLFLGHPSMMRTRVTKSGELIELTRAQFLSLIQTDTDIGDVVMRAYIYRRLELIAEGLGDVVLIGSMHLPATLRSSPQDRNRDARWRRSSRTSLLAGQANWDSRATRHPARVSHDGRRAEHLLARQVRRP
jgi:thioredoxin reductase (NADPH)